jgi:hypothetical protein
MKSTSTFLISYLLGQLDFHAAVEYSLPLAAIPEDTLAYLSCYPPAPVEAFQSTGQLRQESERADLLGRKTR